MPRFQLPGLNLVILRSSQLDHNFDSVKGFAQSLNDVL